LRCFLRFEGEKFGREEREEQEREREIERERKPWDRWASFFFPVNLDLPPTPPRPSSKPPLDLPPKPQLTSFADLSPAIADARFVGPSAEKKARAALASTILPRLAMHEGLPPSLVGPLLALWQRGRPGGSGARHSPSSAVAYIDAKTSRLALSIAGLLLGPGEAGTPTPLPGAALPSAAADAGAAEAVRASLAQVPGLDASSSADASDPSPGLTEGALRLLAAAARGANSGGGGAAAAANASSSSSSSSSPPSSKWDADFVSALGVALARGEARAAAFVGANGEAGAAALAALAAAAADAATEGGASDGGVGASGASSSTSAKILGALTSSSSAARRRATAAAAAVADSSDALHGALAAARASLRGRALRDAALRAGAGAGSADPLCARHALALMAGVARGDPARAARAFGLMSGGGSRSRKSSSASASPFDLAAAAATALASYETSALVLGAATTRMSASGSAAAAAATAPPSSSSSAFSSAPSPTPGLNLDDPLARVSAARLMGAMLFAGIGGGSAAAAVSYASSDGGGSDGGGGGGASLYSLLSALATRDADDMVALEACKALAGWSGVVAVSNAAPFSSSSSSSFSNSAVAASAWANYDGNSNGNSSSNSSLDEASARDAAARARAFAVLCARAGDATVFVPGLVAEEASSGLLAALCSRVRGALGSGNAPLVCAGARAAAALAEAAVRGYDAAVGRGLGLGGGGGGSSSSNGNDRRAAGAAVAAIASLAAPLAGVTCSSSPAEAELALEALLWMQAMPAPTWNSPPLVVLDAGKVFALAGCLSEALATAALVAARRVLAAAAPRALAPGPAASPPPPPLRATALERTLLVSTALVAGNPSGSRGEAALPELWATAARLGGCRGRAAAARAALAVLEAPCPVLLASSPSSSSSGSTADLAASVADDLAWTGVQQSAAWWLGEHGNAASGEVVGGGAIVDGGGRGGAGGAAAMATGPSASGGGGGGGGGGASSSAPIAAALSLASGRCVGVCRFFVSGLGKSALFLPFPPFPPPLLAPLGLAWPSRHAARGEGPDSPPPPFPPSSSRADPRGALPTNERNKLPKSSKNSSPLLADIVAALQHACAATLPPHARPTAALALCKIAVRSDEPYCSSAFGFLVALLGGGARASSSSPTFCSSSPDPLGVAPFVADAVAALDEVYSSRVALQGLVKARLAELAAERKEKEKKTEEKKDKKEKNKAGGASSGPAAARGSDGGGAENAALFDDATLAAVREQHGAVCARLQRLTGLLPDRAYPLGPLSRSLLENGGAELLLQAAAAESIERSERSVRADATTSEERVEAERAKLEALLLGGGRAISEVGSSDDEAEVAEARAAAAAAAAGGEAATGGGHRRRSSMAADDDDSDGDGGGGFSTTPPPPQLLSARSMAFSSTADPLANLTRMLDEQILTGAAAGPTPFASVKQQQQGGGGFEAAAAASSSAADPAAAENGDDDDDGDFSRDALATYGSNDGDLSSYPPPQVGPYYGTDDALARATATPPRGGGREFGSSLSQQQQQQQPLLLGIVEHAFDAALPEELSVVPGDRVQVRGEADGWLDCVLVVAAAAAAAAAPRGSPSPPSGLVPESYVRYVGDGEFAEAGRRQLEEERKKLLQRQVSELSASRLSPQGSLTPRAAADWLSKPDMLAALVGGGGGGGGGGGEGSGDGDGDAGASAGGFGSRALERQTSANPFGQRTPPASLPAASPRALSRKQSDTSGAASAATPAAAATTAASTSTALSPSSSNHRAAFAFSAENDDELSVSEGEQLTVLASVDGWVQVENSAGERGLVPESYVEKV